MYFASQVCTPTFTLFLQLSFPEGNIHYNACSSSAICAEVFRHMSVCLSCLCYQTLKLVKSFILSSLYFTSLLIKCFQLDANLNYHSHTLVAGNHLFHGIKDSKDCIIKIV